MKGFFARQTAAVPGLLLAASLVPASASAHGIWGHIHVTGWAIENLPPGELRDFFADPVVRNAAHFGAAFTDSGYWPQSGDLSARSRTYSEHTHWEPFIEDFIEWIAVNDPPPWDTIESRQRVAFLMGCAAHGLQDEIFDSLFLYQVEEKDEGDQGNADPGSDGFMVLDGHVRFVPTPWVPYDTLLELYAELTPTIDRRTIEISVQTMVGIYVNPDGTLVAESLGNQYLPELPWTYAHYLDPDIPGSLRAEIVPTALHLLALWERLHGRFEPADLVVHAYPDTDRRLLSGVAGSPDSWATFVFGAGVEMSTVSTTLTGEEGDVPFTSRGTRWGGDRGFTRLIRFQPTNDLTPGGEYEATLLPGAEIITGQVLDTAISHTFQVQCATADDPACPPLDPFVAAIDGSGPGIGAPDEDAGAPDAAGDAGLPDSSTDAGNGEDAGTDAVGDVDSQPPSSSQPGGCSAAATGVVGVAWWLLPLVFVRRRTAIAT